MIYIDPPYNTGGDANIFTYNNTFNHSTWLTFMRNRLEAGKQLLKDDGFIAIAIDHCELLYLGVLADEIFGRENRLGIISVLHNPEGRQNAKYFTATNEFMLIYKKSESSVFNPVYLQENFKDSKNINEIYDKKDEIGIYKQESFIRLGGGDACLRKNKSSAWYSLYVSQNLKDISLEKKDGYVEVLPITDSGQERTWKIISKSFKKKFNNGDIYAIRENNKIKIFEKYRIEKGSPITTCWINKKYNAKKTGTNLLEEMFGDKIFSYPKSLYTIIDTLKIMTSHDDIILDFHAGSGTTGHATLALNKEDGGNRKFILVEQLDEHIEICNERNQKVLAQENINDSFIYFELAKWNETAKEKILACENLDKLIKFFDEMYEKYFLNYNLKIKDFREKDFKGNEEYFCRMNCFVLTRCFQIPL
jgi:adenine-specific DNA-methyltransferase